MKLTETEVIHGFKKLGVHVHPCVGKAPAHIPSWQTKTQAEVDAYFQKPHDTIGIRTGEQTNGRYIIGLDFDIHHRTTVDGVKTVAKCSETERLFNRVRNKLLNSSDGHFSTSTCGNQAIIVDITDYPDLVTRCKGIGTKPKIEELEILNRMNMIVPPSCTLCKRCNTSHKCRSFFGVELVANCTTKLAKWLLKRLPQPRALKAGATKASKRFKCKTLDTGAETPPSADQLKTLKLILNQLPNKYADDYLPWRKVGWALRNYNNSKEVFQLYDEFSKRSSKYDAAGCRDTWNQAHEGRIGIGFIIKAHKDSHNESKTQIVYDTLSMRRSFDMLQGVENIQDIEIQHIDTKYITTTDGSISMFADSDFMYNGHVFEHDRIVRRTVLDIDAFEGKMIIVRSHTGSGKTTAMKQIKRSCDMFGVRVKSVVSRRTLAKFHANELGIAYYEDIKSNHKDWYNCAVQLESIRKMRFTGEPFVLLLDEVTSLFAHLMSEKPGMSKIRYNLLVKLYAMIGAATAVFAMDADLTAATVRMLKRISSKDVTLYVNDYKEVDKCDLIEYSGDKDMVDALVREIKKDKPVFVCSDCKRAFEVKVVNRVRAALADHPELLAKVRFYSAEDGDKNDFITTDQWKNMFIHVTPTVLYGIDCNYEASVYGFYYRHHLTAFNVVQQLNRVRKPTCVNVFFHSKSYDSEFDCIEDYSLAIKDARGEYSELIKHVPTVTNGYQVVPEEVEKQLREAYEEFAVETQFTNEQFRAIRYYTLEIMRSKGFVIKTGYKSSLLKDKSNKFERLQDYLAMMLRDEDIQAVDAARMQLLEKRFEYICSQCELRRQSEDMKEFLMKIVMDDSRFSGYFAYKFLKGKKKVTIEEDLAKSDDFTFHKLSSLRMKCIHILKLSEKLGITDVFNYNIKDHIDCLLQSERRFKVSKGLVTAFRLRGKAYSGVESKIKHMDCAKLLMDMCRSVFSGLVKVSKCKHKGTQYRYKVFDHEQLRKLDSILPHKVDYSKRMLFTPGSIDDMWNKVQKTERLLEDKSVFALPSGKYVYID